MAIKNVYYLTKAQYNTLVENGSVTLSDGVTTVTYNTTDMYCVAYSEYRHNLMLELTDSGDTSYCVATIYNEDSTQFDPTTFEAYVQANGAIQASGYRDSSVVLAIAYNSPNIQVICSDGVYTVTTITVSDNPVLK